MLLVVTYSRGARTSLRNVCRTHGESVVRRFGRAALLEETEHGAFLALRLREKHPDDVQLERTEPFNEFRDVPAAVREAATKGLDVLLLAVTTELSAHTDRLRDQGISYEVVEAPAR